MVGTPKLQRKSSLSLSTRLKNRHSASPQNRLKNSTSNCEIITSNWETLQRSPSVISICSDGGIECTPPHKKMSIDLDESLEFSPKIFDNSYSPTCMLSQTLAIDSPEVGWKWSRYSANGGRTPDSAYAADSSFTSAGSSSTEVAGIDCTRGNTNKVRINKHARREDQRQMLEKELRRVEKTRAEEKLKQRCEKLQEQLKSAGTQKLKTNDQLKEKNSKENSDITISSSLNNVEMKCPLNTSKSTKAAVKSPIPEKPKNPELLSDFFNDSALDCLLLEATQEIESKMENNTQPDPIYYASTTPKSSTAFEGMSIPYLNSVPVTTSTSPSNKAASHIADKSSNTANKNKRSSFYMKFLEDDCPDDWFVSLDEVILQATQNKKSRTSLQRYKSMPAETSTMPSDTLNKKVDNVNCIMNSRKNPDDRVIILEDTATSSSTNSKMKRHSSTHTLNPVGMKSRSRRQL